MRKRGDIIDIVQGRLFAAALSLLALFALISCDKEDRENIYSSQDEEVEQYAKRMEERYRTLFNNGAYRIVEKEGSGAPLAKGDSLYFYYSAYTFSSGAGSIYATNIKEVAERYSLYTDGKPIRIEYGKEQLLSGLQSGLEGVTKGENCIIVFSSRYGHGNQSVFNLPKLTSLYFEIKVDNIIKNE